MVPGNEYLAIAPTEKSWCVGAFLTDLQEGRKVNSTPKFLQISTEVVRPQQVKPRDFYQNACTGWQFHDRAYFDVEMEARLPKHYQSDESYAIKLF